MAKRTREAVATPLEFTIGAADQLLIFPRYIRQWQGVDIPGIECSTAYQAGQWTAFAVELATGVSGVVKAGGKFALRKALKEGVEEFGDDALRAAKNPVSDALSRAKHVEDRLETTLDDGTKVIFRKDVGPNAHPIGSKYPNPVDHYNIEVHVPGRVPGRFNQTMDVHVIVNSAGKAVDIIR